MDLSSCRIVKKICLLLTLTFAGGCLKRSVDGPIKQTQGLPTDTPIEQIVTPLTKVQPVVGSKLKTGPLSLNANITDKHRSLEISAEADPDADYLEFTICKVDDGSCSPGPEAPGVMTSPSHSIPSPPEGLVEVSIRSCARSYKSTEAVDACGPWVSKKYVQQPNEDSEIASMLVTLYQQENIIREECRKIRRDIVAYFNENEAALSNAQSATTQQFHDLLHNNLVVGEDRCAELHLNNMLELVETDFEYSSAAEAQTTESLSLTEEKDKNVKAALVLTVGAMAFLGGTYQGGSRLLSLKSLNAEIEGLSDRYEKTLVSIRQGVNFSTLKRESLEELVSRHGSLKVDLSNSLEILRSSDEGRALNRKLGEKYKSWNTVDFDNYLDKILLNPAPSTLSTLGLESDPFNTSFKTELGQFRSAYRHQISLAYGYQRELSDIETIYKTKANQFYDGTAIREEFRANDDFKLFDDISKHGENVKRIDNAFYEEIAARTKTTSTEVRKQFDEKASPLDHQLKSKRTELQRLNDTGFRTGVATIIFGALIAGIAYNSLDLTQSSNQESTLLEKLNQSYKVISNSSQVRYQISNSIEKESSP